MQTVEVKFLGSVLGYFLLDKKKSEDIMEELHIYNVNDKSVSVA
jgi:hypothetical protein